MSIVYLPVEPIEGMTSAERADAMNRETWNLYRPDSIKNPNDVTRHAFPEITHPETSQVAIVGQTDEQVYISPEVDLTRMLELLPEVPQVEKDQLVAYVEVSKGSYIPFSTLIPSSSAQLTEAEAIAGGWIEPNVLEE